MSCGCLRRELLRAITQAQAERARTTITPRNLKILRGHQTGLSYRQLAERFGMTRTGISGVLSKTKAKVRALAEARA